MRIVIILIVGLCCGAVCALPNVHLQRTCDHNGRTGVSNMDTIEHAGNGEYGSIARDYYDMYKGNQRFVGNDNPKPEPQQEPEQQEPQQSFRFGENRQFKF